MPAISSGLVRFLQASTIVSSVPSLPISTAVESPAGNLPATVHGVKHSLTKRDDDDDWKIGLGTVGALGALGAGLHYTGLGQRGTPLDRGAWPGRQITPKPEWGGRTPSGSPEAPWTSEAPDLLDSSLSNMSESSSDTTASPKQYSDSGSSSGLSDMSSEVPASEFGAGVEGGVGGAEAEAPPIEPADVLAPETGSPPIPKTPPIEPGDITVPEGEAPPIESGDITAPEAETPPVPEIPPETRLTCAGIGEFGLHYFSDEGEVNMQTSELIGPPIGAQEAPQPQPKVHYFGSKGEINPLSRERIHTFGPEGEIDILTGKLLPQVDGPDDLGDIGFRDDNVPEGWEHIEVVDGVDLSNISPESQENLRQNFMKEHPDIEPTPEAVAKWYAEGCKHREKDHEKWGGLFKTVGKVFKKVAMIAGRIVARIGIRE